MKTFLRLILAFLMLLIVGCSVARPLRRSEASIQASVLKHTPIGTPRADVRSFIARQRWELQRDGRVPVGTPSPRDEVCFGGYTIFFGTCYVYGVWTFDATNRLVDFNVSKSRDVL